MTQTCPVCNRAVDPLRARAVGVRDGKVVAYCSTECARAAETKPTVMPAKLAEAVKSAEPTPATPAKPEAAKPEAAKPEAAKPDAAKPGAPKGEARKPGAADTAGKAAAAKADGAKAQELGTTKRSVAAPVAEVDPIPGEDDEGGRSGSKLAALLAVLVLGGGGAFLAYRYLVAPANQAEPPEKTTLTAPPAVIDAATPDAHVVSAEEAVAKAREVLKQGLTAGTPRVQRVAAGALARTGDADAIALLVAALPKETTDAARLEIAYWLARGGDKRGSEALVAGLSSGRRDTKLEAGRLLAQLRDKRAIHTLENYLAVSQLRLGTAEVLANFAEPRALEVLDKVRADAKASPDDRARATIALGIAGRTDVAPDLHQLLAVDGFNAFAASTLARMHDAAARPVLVGMLGIASLRVEAARSLRVLDPHADTAAERTMLFAALTSEKDTVQLQAAEALLLLAGDPAWSERP